MEKCSSRWFTKTSIQYNKRVKQFKIASLKSDNIAVTMRPMEYRPQTEERTMKQKVDIVDLANEEIKTY